MNSLTLKEASAIVQRALEKGRALKLKPLSVAVLDVRGMLISYASEDGSSLLRFDIAHGKAYGAMGMGMGSAAIEKMTIARPHFFGAVGVAAGGSFIPGAGGVLVRDKDGAIVGAVGVSGDTSNNDEICAVAGIAATDKIADPGSAA